MNLVTMSALPRLVACPPSGSLPQVVELDEEPARRGTALHEFLADVAELGRDEALARIEDWEHRDACEKIDVTALPMLARDQYSVEVAFSYNVRERTARVLGQRIGRRYLEHGVDPAIEIAGAADVVGLLPDAVIVWDYKSGHRRIPPAAQHWQLRALAVAAAKAYGRDRAFVGLVHLKHDGTPWFDAAELDEFELLTAEDELAGLWERLGYAREDLARGLQPIFTTGSHCRFCPAIRSCPAQTALIRAVIDDPPAGNLGPGPLTPERIAETYRRAKSAQEILDRLMSAIYAHAAVQAIELGDGLVLGNRVVQREEVVGDVARRVLIEMHGADVADRACRWSVTKTAIEDAMRVIAAKSEGKLKVTQLVRAVLDQVREKHGIVEHSKARVEEHRPKRSEYPKGGGR